MLQMGVLCKLVDAVLFIFFLVIAIFAPLLDAQTCLPNHLFPPFLLELKSWYAQEYGDYLFSEKPHFFVGLVWVELIFQWPLAVASIYAIAAGKSWLSTTCLLYGASTLTTMVAVLSELSLSNRASDQLLTIYYPFLGFALLALLRGLLANSGKNITMGKRTAIPRKKRA
ncbi:transmembrane protein 97 [Phtheirospermum japonicum]|uniref:Transmembrane protein 97 n=1 Tax=Phtheirospermum japonicum TaxID=374723 RepID=A0A830BBW6_9LAMI|nr:transmembrane protein 97 [Phtheirospermum japonicum]